MKQIDCPQCGAAVKFQTAVAVFATCEFCQAMIVRHDLDVSLIGKQAQLPDDQSPFQIGTIGTIKGVNFTLQGRFRVKWQDGFWNEWFAWCDDGRIAWLAEAQGFLSFYFEVNSSSQNTDRGDVVEGMQITIDGHLYKVADIKEAEIVGSEGELPFKAPPGRKSLSVDLNGDYGRTATLEFAEADGQPTFRTYCGFYCDFDDFKFANLRQIDGW